MWGSFLLCATITLLSLYVPGYFFFRAVRVSRILSVGCAPIYSIAAFGLLPILYQKAGVFCNGVTLLLPALVLPLILFLVLNRRGYQQYEIAVVDRQWLLFALYLVVGIGATWFILISGLGDFDTFYNRHDNSTHLNAIRAFVESGNWSSLGMNTYLASPQNAIPWDTGSGFYPSAWHDVVSISASLINCPEAIAVNACNAVITGVVYPASMFLVMLSLFPNDRTTIAIGSVITPCFNSFPWYFFLKGPLVGNMLSFAIIPAICVLFVVLCKTISPKVSRIVTFGCVALLACAALGLAQPNGLFTFYIFAVAFLGHQLRAHLVKRYESGRISRAKMALLVFAFAAVVVALWAVAFNLPALQSIVTYHYDRDNGLGFFNTLYDTVSLGLVASYPQWLLAASSLIGILVFTARKKTWMVFPPFFFAVAYYCARAFSNPFPRQYVAGFWYSDPVRLAACLTIFLTPFASLGLASLIRLLVRVICELAVAGEKTLLGKSAKATLGIILVVIATCYLYFPNYSQNIWNEDKRTKTPIGVMKQRITDEYSTEREQVYSAREREFVRKALDAIPEGALVINQPHDGSVFAYGLDGLNTYFRSAGSFGYSETADTIREGMNNLATSEEVQDAVKSTGAEYLLLLDQGVAYQDGKWLSTYYDSYVPLWDGLNKVTDDTPGFELVLAEDDMRLYKISPEYTGATS